MQKIIATFFVALLYVGTIGLAQNVPSREWTAKSGHKITCVFISVQDDTVKISQPDGFTAEIPLYKLSEEDQRFVESQSSKEEENPFVIRRESPTSTTPVELGYATPLNILEQEAQKDNPEALMYLATLYLQGTRGYHKDEKKAEELSQRGSQFADTGNPAAQCCRGRCYYYGWGVSKSLTEAVKWYRLAAEQGYAPGQTFLGARYADGEGVREDKAEAVEWYRKAAEQGDALGQQSLGTCYCNGTGVRKDDEESVRWHRKAAEQGHAQAQYSLGLHYASGEGVDKNPWRAAEWYSKAAEQGLADAQCNLGACYYDGEGVLTNPAEAVNWCRLAADQGNAGAQFVLGVCYENGEGVRKNTTEAVNWYRTAADQGLAQAQCNLGGCYALGEGVHKDMTEAAKWFRKAAEQGNADAQCRLGACYALGNGVPKSESDAEQWFHKSAGQGWEPAKEILRQMQKERVQQPPPSPPQAQAKADGPRFINGYPPGSREWQAFEKMKERMTSGEPVWGNWRGWDNRTQAIVQEFTGYNSRRDVRAVQYRVNNDGWYQIKFQMRSFNYQFINDEIVVRINQNGRIIEHINGGTIDQWQ